MKRDTDLFNDQEQELAELAIHGGQPAVTLELPTWPPAWQNVAESVNRALANGSWGRYHGLPLQEFVSDFADFTGVSHVWPCSSGTIAVELGLRGLAVRSGDEVIMGGYDFPGNFRAVEAVAATPMLVDVCENGFVISASEVEAAINSRTKAVVVSHLHGQLADVHAIRAICEPRRIAVLEDACQVPGATVNGCPAGSLGDVGIFSFGGSKLLTAGRGGAVVTRRDDVIQRIRISAERGNDAYPLSALQAAALKPQLETVQARHLQRIASAHRLRGALKDSAIFSCTPDLWNDEWSPAFFKFPVQVASEFDRQTLIEILVAEGVPADSGFRGFIRRSGRRCQRTGTLDNARIAADKTILLHHPFMIGETGLTDQVIQAFQKVERCARNR